VPYSNALQSRIRARGHYLVGPAARYSLNFDRLSPLAQEAARTAGLGAVCRDPYQASSCAASRCSTPATRRCASSTRTTNPSGRASRSSRGRGPATAAPRRRAAASRSGAGHEVRRSVLNRIESRRSAGTPRRRPRPCNLFALPRRAPGSARSPLCLRAHQLHRLRAAPFHPRISAWRGCSRRRGRCRRASAPPDHRVDAELRRADRADIATGTGADHEQPAGYLYIASPLQEDHRRDLEQRLDALDKDRSVPAVDHPMVEA
jgi:hypothetical protein